MFVGNSSLAYSDELNTNIANLQSQLNTAKIDLNTKIDNNINSLNSQINTINSNIANLQTKVASSSSTYTFGDYVDIDSCTKSHTYRQVITEEKTFKLTNGPKRKIQISYIMSNDGKQCIGLAQKVFYNKHGNIVSEQDKYTSWEWIPVTRTSYY